MKITFPAHLFPRLLYWLFHKLRRYVILAGVYALLEYSLRLPLFLFVEDRPHINADVFLSAQGLLPLLGLGILFAGTILAAPIDNPLSDAWRSKFFGVRDRFLARLSALDSRWTALLPALLPPVIVLTVIYAVWGARLSDYLPIFWNDATGYWLWMRQFSHYGFGGGYNYANELMPAASFNRFGEGSPIYIYFYGLFGRLLGWSPQLPILVNFGLVSGAIYAFARFLRLDTRQNLVLTLVISVSWPVMIFSATTAHESFNQAIAIGLAAIFFFLLQEKRPGPGKTILLVVFVFFAGLLRLSWVILFFPLFYYYFGGTFLRRVFLAGLTGVGLTLGILLVTRYLVPPVNNSIFATLSGSPVQVVRAIAYRFLEQFSELFKYGEMTPSLATIFILLVLLVYSLGEMFRERGKNWLDILHTRSFFDFYNIAVLLLAGMSLYIASGFYRTFFPPLMVSLFLQVARQEYRFVRVFIVLSLLFAPVILEGRSDLSGAKMNYTYQFPGLEESRPALDELVRYDESAENPWCNTILIPLSFYDARLTALHPGIGISYILFHPLQNLPVQSQYLLLDDDDYERFNRRYNLQADLLADLPIGRLYRNLDSNCTP